MRNTLGQERDIWAAYIKAARETARMDKTEFARKIGKNRATISRWEAAENRPEDPKLVVRIAEVLGLDPEEVAAAAGLRPGVEPPPVPTMEVDEEIELVRTDPRLDEDMKRRIITIILERREVDRRRRMEETRQMIELMRRRS